MKYYHYLLIWSIFSSSLVFGEPETIYRDGKIIFAYDEYQQIVDAYNSKVSSSPALTNPYAKPSTFEIAVSTTLKGKEAFAKDYILAEIKKVKSELILLERLETDDGIDTSSEQTKLKTKLAGLKHLYRLAP